MLLSMFYKRLTISLVSFFYITFLSFSVHAIEYDHLVKFAEIKDTQFNWQQVISHPSDEKKFYIFSKEGEIRQIEKGLLNNTPLLSLSTVLNKPDLVQTALVLHPNFSLKELPGYQTFYTAHIESFNTQRRYVRLPKNLLENNEVDLVIYEWKIDILGKKIDLENKREIIRIASPSAETHIQQLSFNPYLKPWQDDYAKLFITLNQNKEHTNIPLYSGAVLRIHPEKFGLRNYTIPDNNPYSENENIENEIVALGAKNLKKIIWQKKNNKQWFSLTTEKNSQHLSVLNYGDDLRKANIKPLWQSSSNNKLHQVVWYEGRKIDNLLYKLITVELTDNEWQLFSLTVAENKNVDKAPIASIPNTDKNTQLGLATSNNLELLLLNLTDGVISQIKAIELSQNSTESEVDKPLAPHASTDYSMIYQWLAIIVIFIIAIFIAVKMKNYDREKSLIRKHYNRFDFSNYGEQIDLYRRHKKFPEVSINIKDIVQNKILLNEEIINVIDTDKVHSFTSEAKSRMNEIFSKEHRLKMIDTRTRLISIEITDNSGSVHKIYLYARRGNQRYTRIDYQECLNMINHWCNKVSEVINPHHVELDKDIDINKS